MFRKVVLVAALVLAAVPRASAQTIEATEVMFHWGVIHKAPGQALAINFQLTDHVGEALTAEVEFRLDDKDGNVIHTNTVLVSSGRAFSIVSAVAPEIRIARSTIQGDIYAFVDPNDRRLAPFIKVTFPPGSTAPVDQMFATLEVIDVLTGRVIEFLPAVQRLFGAR